MANLSRSIPAARGLQGIETFLWTISSQLRRIPLNWLDCPGRFFWVRFLSGLLMFSSLEVLRSTQESTMLNILMSVELLHSQFLNKAVRHAWVLLRLWWPLKRVTIVLSLKASAKHLRFVSVDRTQNFIISVWFPTFLLDLKFCFWECEVLGELPFILVWTLTWQGERYCHSAKETV